MALHIENHGDNLRTLHCDVLRSSYFNVLPTSIEDVLRTSVEDVLRTSVGNLPQCYVEDIRTSCGRNFVKWVITIIKL